MAFSFVATDNPISQLLGSHPTLTAGIISIAVTYGSLWVFLQLTQDSKEPPLVSATVPFISPIIGMVKWSMGFYTHMRDKHPNLPIYTLRLPGMRLYIVNSTTLINNVQRKWRTLIFPPVSARASEFAMGGSKAAMDIMRADMITDAGFMHSFTKAIHPALSRGPELDELTGGALQVMNGMLDEIVAKGGENVKMFEWTRHTFLRATTDSVYGPGNPLRKPENETAWYTFHPTIMFLMLNIIPLWVFRSAIKARARLADAFYDYHTQGQYKEGSAFIRRWTEHFVDQGISDADISRFHNGGLFALVANTIPTAFWTIYRVFSDDSVVRDCREELSRPGVVVVEDDGTRTINVGCVQTSCPTLVSTYQEVFRVHGMANSVRVAVEDHMLDGKYLIKKGGMIMIPARVQHHLPGVWGESVDEFDPRRFIRNKTATTGGEEARHNPVAFRGFGGGTTLCPGRHFATAEILAFTAMLLLRFDIVPTNTTTAGGDLQPWILPSTGNSSQAEAMEQPDHDIDIQLRPRVGAATKWRLSFECGEDVALVAEDLSDTGSKTP